MGYLTGSQRRPGDQEYPRPGLTISGAISLAVEEVNSGLLGKLKTFLFVASLENSLFIQVI